MDLEERNNRHRKKRPKKKPFKIQYRYTGECRHPWHSNEWKVWYQAYATEKARDTALASMIRKKVLGLGGYEYRVAQ